MIATIQDLPKAAPHPLQPGGYKIAPSGYNRGRARSRMFELGTHVLSGLVKETQEALNIHADKEGQAHILAVSIHSKVRETGQDGGLYPANNSPYYYDFWPSLRLFGSHHVMPVNPPSSSE